MAIVRHAFYFELMLCAHYDYYGCVCQCVQLTTRLIEWVCVQQHGESNGRKKHGLFNFLFTFNAIHRRVIIKNFIALCIFVILVFIWPHKMREHVLNLHFFLLKSLMKILLLLILTPYELISL
jgi:hypothetical protein